MINARERVSAALEHKAPVDRVPIFMWFHPDTASRLGKLLEIPPGQVGDAFGNDVCQTWVNNNLAMEGVVHQRDGEWHLDDWGIRWVRAFGFNQVEGYPLAGSTAQEVLNYRFPLDRLDHLFRAMDQVAAQRQDKFLGCDVSPCAFEMYWRLRGMETAMLDIAESPELAAEMFRRCADFAVLLAQEAFRRYALDWLWTGDDVASQNQMMISPRTWRILVKPALQQVFEIGKAHGTWIAYHCCGALAPVIPDLIEMGMDVLNPIQIGCPGMDIFALKREYGQQITLMGGIDTQYLLPYAAEKEVRTTVRRLLDAMQPDGGYILAASHTIPPETPLENIFALYQEAGLSREEIFTRAAEIRQQHRGINES
jgi:uroporphyrinogen decarboxylase